MLESLRWPDTGVIQFRADAGAAPVIVVDLRRLRCAVCGVNGYADQVRTRRLYAPASRDHLELPRRGRPSKWLVAQRRAENSADALRRDF
jgi:hypothetical protein